MNPEPFSLKGQLAIVTGGGRGLGKAIAGELSNAGARVALVSRTRQELEDAAAEIGNGPNGPAAVSGARHRRATWNLPVLSSMTT